MELPIPQPALAQASQLAAKAREAIALRDGAIVKASEAGHTLREIGDAAELAHTTVKRIVDKNSTNPGRANVNDEWTKYKGRYALRPETFDAYVDVWQHVPEARARFSGWVSFSQAASAEPAQQLERVRAAEDCMRIGRYQLGAPTKRGARRWHRGH
jgi:hypothetical protein